MFWVSGRKVYFFPSKIKKVLKEKQGREWVEVQSLKQETGKDEETEIQERKD